MPRSSSRPKMVRVVVAAELPQNVTPEHFRRYIDSAVRTMCGSFAMEDPLFGIRDYIKYVRFGRKDKRQDGARPL